MNTFTCIDCQNHVPISDGHPGRDGFYTVCKSCWNQSLCDQFLAACPPAYLKTDPKLLPAGADAKLRRVLNWKMGPRGLMLCGETGKGKTRSAWLLIKRLMTMDGVEVICYDCISFSHEMERHYRDENFDVTSWLDDMVTADVLFFDDWGKLKLTERVEAELFALLERRCAAEKPTIITTNDTGDTLLSRMTGNRGPALVRRLRDFCEIIAF